MAHVWMNLIAVLFTAFTTTGVGAQRADGVQEKMPDPVSEYAVIDRTEGDDVVLETVRGQFRVPRDMLSEEMAREGAVIEIRIAADERERRLARGRERIERMAVQNVIEL